MLTLDPLSPEIVWVPCACAVAHHALHRPTLSNLMSHPNVAVVPPQASDLVKLRVAEPAICFRHAELVVASLLDH